MPVGRPRAFNAEKALEAALRVFWKKGFEGASLPDLTRAMGINRPSLYAAFGNKEALFRKALDRYADGPAAYIRESLHEPTARKVVEQLFEGAIDLLSDPGHPNGCLVVQGALACGDEADCVREELARRRAARQAALRKRLNQARRDGDLPAGSKPAELARYVMAVIQGMAVQAAGGAGRRELQQIAALALLAWPT